MNHSVWDWDKVRYNYYESPGKASVGGWNPLTGLGLPPPINKNGSPIGIDIELALPLLPPNARYVGHGPQAIGQVCRRRPLTRPQVSGVAGQLGASSDANKTENPIEISEIAAFIGGMSVGAFVFRHSSLALLAVTLSTLLFGVSTGMNHVNRNQNGN